LWKKTGVSLKEEEEKQVGFIESIADKAVWFRISRRKSLERKMTLYFVTKDAFKPVNDILNSA
jgi:hypothetical protein